MIKLSKSIIPRYTYIPLLLAAAVNFIVYYFSDVLTKGRVFYDFSLAIDGVIPFLPIFVVFYVLAYAQWGIGYIVAAGESREYYYRIITADIVAKIICFAVFVIFPTHIVRPEITGTDVFSTLLSFIYSSDNPTKLIPSIHCLESWVCMRAAFSMNKPSVWYKGITCFISIGVFMSVVFVKQHFFVDIPAGIIVFEIGLLLTKVFKIDRIFCIGEGCK